MSIIEILTANRGTVTASLCLVELLSGPALTVTLCGVTFYGCPSAEEEMLVGG